ncbi:MAG: retroviral-like aspartic protease family protein [Chloroflexota bacterium]
MNTSSYSQDYVPPAPILPVSIAIPDKSPETEEYEALVDTGADATFVPTEMLEELELPIQYMANVRSHLGDRLHRVPIHRVDIILFGTIRLPSIEVIGDDWGSQIILGRNVLNKLRIYLNGPDKTTNVEEQVLAP